MNLKIFKNGEVVKTVPLGDNLTIGGTDSDIVLTDSSDGPLLERLVFNCSSEFTTCYYFPLKIDQNHPPHLKVNGRSILPFKVVVISNDDVIKFPDHHIEVSGFPETTDDDATGDIEIPEEVTKKDQDSEEEIEAKEKALKYKLKSSKKRPTSSPKKEKKEQDSSGLDLKKDTPKKKKKKTSEVQDEEVPESKRGIPPDYRERIALRGFSFIFDMQMIHLIYSILNFIGMEGLSLSEFIGHPTIGFFYFLAGNILYGTTLGGRMFGLFVDHGRLWQLRAILRMIITIPMGPVFYYYKPMLSDNPPQMEEISKSFIEYTTEPKWKRYTRTIWIAILIAVQIILGYF